MQKSEITGESSTEITTISEGGYIIKNDILYLYGNKKKIYTYKIVDSVTINPKLTNRHIISKSKLMCSCMCRKDGSVVWKGFWKNGLENGVWFFYDEHGSHVKTVLVKNGTESEEYINPSLMPPNMLLYPYKF